MEGGGGGGGRLQGCQVSMYSSESPNICCNKKFHCKLNLIVQVHVISRVTWKFIISLSLSVSSFHFNIATQTLPFGVTGGKMDATKINHHYHVSLSLKFQPWGVQW